ncbi:MAG TPA: hypothetical protein VM328_03810 [Fimbriimonadaceae bacterium]|nr:hypothetical protein [Fimbriimonadaceae bacterium]
MQQEMREAQAAIAEAQELARSEIAARLRAAYRLEVRALEKELLAEVLGGRGAAYEGVLAQLRTIFEQYADERGPLLIRLTVLVGFPDPDPLSQRTSTSKHVTRMYEEARRLRSEIAELDQEFRAEAHELFAGIESITETQLDDIEAVIANKLEEADRKAHEVASQEVQQHRQAILLAGRMQFRLPQQAGATVVVPGTAGPTAAPRVEPAPALDEATLLQHDLEIWLDVNGYRLAAHGRDATKEFVQWRRNYRDGQ